MQGPSKSSSYWASFTKNGGSGVVNRTEEGEEKKTGKNKVQDPFNGVSQGGEVGKLKLLLCGKLSDRLRKVT